MPSYFPRFRIAEEEKDGPLFKHLVPSCLRKQDKEPEIDSSLRSALRQKSIQNMMMRVASRRNSKSRDARLKMKVLKATKSLYMKVIGMASAIYAVAVFGLALILYTAPIALRSQTMYGLQVSIAVQHSIFFLCALFIWNGASLQSYFDAMIGERALIYF